MRKVTLADLDSRMGPADVVRPLTDALGATDVALNYYELDPGESFAYGFHAHENQEEVFYVQQGTVTFRTADGDVTAAAGEVVRFGPGEYQRGVNRGEDRVVALALGAPQDAGETEILRECEDCGVETPQGLSLAAGKSAVVVTCEECGSETDRYT
jgi:mannose-6-phosphate isomerase-like protein (cupin superfamily)